MSTEAKPWYLSKTVWVNAITTLVALVTAVTQQDWVSEHPQAASGLAAFVAILNVALRFITSMPVRMSAIVFAFIGASLFADTADACNRCGLFGRRCRFASANVFHHKQAFVDLIPYAQPNQVINVTVGTPAVYGYGSTIYQQNGVSGYLQAPLVNPQAYIDDAKRLAEQAQQLAQKGMEAFTSAGNTALALQSQNQRLALTAATLQQALQPAAVQGDTKVTLELKNGQWQVCKPGEANHTPTQSSITPPNASNGAGAAGASILSSRCLECHSGAQPAGQFSLDVERFSAQDHLKIFRMLKARGTEAVPERMRKVLTDMSDQEVATLMDWVDENTAL